MPDPPTELSRRVTVNDADTFGYTALHAAAGYAQAEVMEYLLSIGANVHAGDCDGDTPLHQAESVECAALLLKAGAVLDARNSKGQTVRCSILMCAFIQFIAMLCCLVPLCPEYASL